MKYPDWTPEENRILKKAAKAGMTAIEIAGERLLPAFRTVDGIVVQARVLELKLKRGDVLSLLPQSLSGSRGLGRTAFH